MTDSVIRLSGLPLIAGAVLLGAAIVRVSFNPVVNQSFSPLLGPALLLGWVDLR